MAKSLLFRTAGGNIVVFRPDQHGRAGGSYECKGCHKTDASTLRSAAERHAKVCTAL